MTRSLAAPAFPDDDGSADPALAAALTTYGERPGDPAAYLGVLARLQHARVLVPVTAVLVSEETGDDGLRRDKDSDMAAVLMRNEQGSLALLGFSSTATLASWDPQARPVPVTTRDAAQAALDDDATALVLDLAGPVRFVVDGDHLRALAAGYRLAKVDGGVAWVDVPS